MTMFLVANTAAWGQNCAMPMAKINVAGIGLNAPFTDFQRQHPDANIQRFGNDRLQVAFTNSNTDARLSQQGVMSAMHIALHPRTERIVSYGLNFTTDNGAITFQTPLDKFKQHLLQKFALPKTGWQKQANEYVYRCDDYRIHIGQDHGIARQSMGATIVVIGKYSDMFEP